MTFRLLSLAAIILLRNSILGSHAAWINAADFQEKLGILKDQGLGVQSWQNYLDDLEYQVDLPSGATLADQFAGQIGSKFNKQIEAIKKLKQKIEQLYASFPISSSPSDRCCKMQNLKYDPNFLTKVDRSRACEIIPDSASAGQKFLSEDVIDVMKKNLVDNPQMKWQFFGSKTGVMTVYPSEFQNCSSYDPRFRPWYVEASTPIRKHVVLVIDCSLSMKEIAEPPAPRSLMDIAKEAAKTLLDTLTTRDLIGVVGFNNEVETLEGCFNDTMAVASQNNIKLLKSFVAGLTPSGSTSYKKSLQKAFALLNTADKMAAISDNDGQSAKVILFLTDGVPNKPSPEVMTELERLRTTQNVTIMTYGLGAGLSTSAVDILKQIASKTGGKFVHIDKPSKLRTIMGSYYEIFSSKTSPENQAAISLPYLDTFGLGIVTTVTIPVFHKSEMVGVIGIDVPMDDLFSDEVFNRHYLFVIDKSGRAWRHPLLPRGSGGNIVSSTIDIGTLERNSEAARVIESMERGEKGEKKFVSDHLIAIGDPVRDGVEKQNLVSTYFWSPVPGFNLSLCLAMIHGDVENVVKDDSVRENAKFVYHRRDIVEPTKLCKHVNRISTMQATIKFSPECFLDPESYLTKPETAESIAKIERYMTYKTNLNPGFRAEIRPTCAMTSKANDIWDVKNWSEIQKYIIWRYIGTYNGIICFVPLAKIDTKDYNPTRRSWYRRALSQPGKSVFSTPYLDAFGAGFIATISHTLYLGNSTRAHKPGDTIVGVLGADFTLDYLFYKFLGGTFPKCKEDGFSCFILDNSGYIIIHQDFVETRKASMEYMHVTVKDSVLARALIEGGYMTNRGCIDITKMTDQICWKLDLGSSSVRQLKSTYEVSAVADTNIFIVVKKNNTLPKTPCSCSAESILSVNVFKCQPLGTCQCPCYRATTFSTCEDKLSVNSTSYVTCTQTGKPIFIKDVSKEEKEKAKDLAYCYQEDCNKKKIWSECIGLIGCTWCRRRDVNGNALEKPYCASFEQCYPPDGEGPPGTGLSPGAIAGIAVGVIVVVALIILVVLLILHLRGVITISCPCAKNDGQSSMKMTNAESMPGGINNPYGQAEAAKHFDPVVLDDEFM